VTYSDHQIIDVTNVSQKEPEYFHKAISEEYIQKTIAAR